MADSSYREFDNAKYSKLRRDLLRTKGGELQDEFLDATRNDGKLLAFMKQVPTTGTKDVTPCPCPLTETEYRNPPVDTQMMLYEAWATIVPRIACRSSFWGYVTLDHIRHGRIKSVYLAANRKYPGGAERIDRILGETGDRRAQMMDDCVRTVLRRLGGLPEARGNKTVYVDCPLARAWWRERLVVQVARHAGDARSRIRDVVRLSKAYWEKLVVMVVSRNSVFGSHEIRDAFIICLADAIESGDNSRLTTTGGLQRGYRNLSAIQAVRELSVLDADELREVVEGVVSAI